MTPPLTAPVAVDMSRPEDAADRKPPTILFYIDSAAALPQCTAAAEILRHRLGARIVMMLVGSADHKTSPLTGYEVYDCASLFRKGEFRPVWSGSGPSGPNGFIAVNRVQLWLRGRTMRRLRRFLVDSSLGQLFGAKRLEDWAAQKVATIKPPIVWLAWVGRVGRLVARSVSRAIRLAASSLGKLVRPGGRLQSLIAALRRVKYWMTSVRGVRRFVAQIKPDVIILGEDNIETLGRAFVHFGRRNGAQALILPFTLPNPLEPARYYFDNPRNQVGGVLARLVARIWPKWQFEHADRRLLRLDPLKVLAIEALGLSTQAPWVLNHGNSGAIALDSEAQRDHYLRLGFPAGQLCVIGDANGEVLAKGLAQRTAQRAAMLDELGMPEGRPLIVCAFPPDQYHGASQGTFEFATFEALVAAWMQSFHLLGDRANVLVRPHPRLDPKRLAAFERPNVRVSLRPTVDLVPFADLYVASISATIRWAICCGIPVINYDCYRLRYGDFAGAEAVVNVEDRQAFTQVLARFVDDAAYAATLRRQQEAVSGYWGMIDDGYGARLAGSVERLCADRV